MSGDRYIEKLVILDHEKHIISYLFEEPLQFPATGLYGKQELESIAPGKTLLTWISDAESFDEDLKDTMYGLIQLCIAGLVELLEKRQIGVSN
ncbi:hypothetical protein H9Q69_012543 [Fusarium xylarioides]|uniref:Uncharacterized protein n=1 Tax=Fusarium xylarioides TaxID=221167 RepID=A0A9P7HZ02_9HYPO|nr:hypothetical protein H9Q70_008456 [Fusarium xylarioides]KAG5764671.1 hypothetical protein H9Q72_007223 [Fusarium xylarioides]KAG5776565.1 hypothetical protein H9Q73_009777 [Fusarium xylarioides]KAG5788398.1 hypothetical protein H9Q69_012543 [Fusarium xylarioides]